MGCRSGEMKLSSTDITTTDITYNKILELARSSSEHAFIESDISEEYLRAYLRQGYTYSPEKVVRKLLAVKKAYAKLGHMEARMDKDAFKATVKKDGFGVVSGRSVDGNVLIWINLRSCLEGTTGFSENSPQALAWLRGLFSFPLTAPLCRVLDEQKTHTRTVH